MPACDTRERGGRPPPPTSPQPPTGTRVHSIVRPPTAIPAGDMCWLLSVAHVWVWF